MDLSRFLGAKSNLAIIRRFPFNRQKAIFALKTAIKQTSAGLQLRRYTCKFGVRVRIFKVNRKSLSAKTARVYHSVQDNERCLSITVDKSVDFTFLSTMVDAHVTVIIIMVKY